MAFTKLKTIHLGKTAITIHDERNMLRNGTSFEKLDSKLLTETFDERIDGKVYNPGSQ